MDKVTRRPSRYWGTRLTECVGNSANGLESVDRSDKSRVNMSVKKKTYVTGTGTTPYTGVSDAMTSTGEAGSEHRLKNMAK